MDGIGAVDGFDGYDVDEFELFIVCLFVCYTLCVILCVVYFFVWYSSMCLCGIIVCVD